MSSPFQQQQEAAMGDSDTAAAAAATMLHYEIVNTYDDAYEDERLQASVRLFEVQQGPLLACSSCGQEIRPSESQFAAMSSWVDLSVTPPVVHALLARDVGLRCQMCLAMTASATALTQAETASAAASPEAAESLPSELSTDGLEVEERTELICGEVQGTTVRTAKMDVSYSRYYLLSLRHTTKASAAPDPTSTSEFPTLESEQLQQTSQQAEQEPTRVDSAAGAASWAASHSGQLSAADAERLQRLEFTPSGTEVQVLSHVLMAVADWVLGQQSLAVSPGDAGFSCGPDAPLLVRLRPWAFAARANEQLQLHGSRVRPSLLCLGGSRLGKPPTCLLELLNAPPNRFSAAREVMESAAAAAAGRRRQDGTGREVASYCASWVLPIQRLAALMKRHFNKTQGPWQLSASRIQGRLEALLEGDAVYLPQPRQQLMGRRGAKIDTTPGVSPSLSPVEALLRDLGATPQQVLEVLSLAEIDGNVGFCSECGCTGDLVACDICVDSFCTDCLGGVDPEELPDPWNCRFCARFPHLQAPQPANQTPATKRRQEPTQDAPGSDTEQLDGKRARLTAKPDQPGAATAVKRRQERPPKRPVSMPPVPLLPLSPNIMNTATPTPTPPPAAATTVAAAAAPPPPPLAVQLGGALVQQPHPPPSPLPPPFTAVAATMLPEDPRLKVRAAPTTGEGGGRGRDEVGPDGAASVGTGYSSDASGSGPGAGGRQGRQAAEALLTDLAKDDGTGSGGGGGGGNGGSGSGAGGGSGGGRVGLLSDVLGLPPLPYVAHDGGAGTGEMAVAAAAAAGPSRHGDASAPVARGGSSGGVAGGSGRGRGRGGRGKGRTLATAAAGPAAGVLGDGDSGGGSPNGRQEGSVVEEGPGSMESQHAAAALLLLTMQHGAGKGQAAGPELQPEMARRKSGQDMGMLLAAGATPGATRQQPASSYQADGTADKLLPSGAVAVIGDNCGAAAVGGERPQQSQQQQQHASQAAAIEAQHEAARAPTVAQHHLPAAGVGQLPPPVLPRRNTVAIGPSTAPAPNPAATAAAHINGSGTLVSSETLPLTATPSSAAWSRIPGAVLLGQLSTRPAVALPAEAPSPPQPAPSRAAGHTVVEALGSVGAPSQQPPVAFCAGTVAGECAAAGGTLAPRQEGVAGQVLSLEEATLLGFRVLQIAAEAGVDAGVVAAWMAVLNAALEHYGAQPALSGVLSSCLRGLCSGHQLHPTVLKASTEMLARLLRAPQP